MTMSSKNWRGHDPFAPLATPMYGDASPSDVIGQFYCITKTYFFGIKHLQSPSPKRPIAETASPNCPRPMFVPHEVPWAVCNLRI